jgi:hypothetical protein
MRNAGIIVLALSFVGCGSRHRSHDAAPTPQLTSSPTVGTQITGEISHDSCLPSLDWKEAIHSDRNSEILLQVFVYPDSEKSKAIVSKAKSNTLICGKT